MFVSKLYTDKWIGNKNEENFIEHPNWQQIKTAICNLDGKSKTLVSLETDDQSYMMIGGGNDGQYIVTATLDNEIFYSLLHQVNNDEKKINLLTFRQSLTDAKSNMAFPNHKKFIRVRSVGNRIVTHSTENRNNINSANE